jgi:hypothetical protein
MLTTSVVKRLMLSRFFLNLASEHAHGHREVSAFAAANLLQDAVEIFLLGAAEYVNARIGRATEFCSTWTRLMKLSLRRLCLFVRE